MKRVFLLLLVFSTLLTQKVYAQYDNDDIVVETAPVQVSLVEDKEHSPGKATLYSAVLPGLGQAYNKHYWKIPVIYAGAGAVTYLAITNRRDAKKYKQEYIHRDNGGKPTLLENYPNESILNLYNTRQKNFELSLIFGGVVYLVNILDAYVFAHLFSFTINDDISMNLAPQINYTPYIPDTSPSIGVRWSISF